MGSSRNHSTGIIYVAIGASFVAESSLSAKSVRRFLPDIPILLYTDQDLESHQDFDEVIRLSPPHPRAQINKLIAMTRSPFDNTLLLDTDTYVCADISDLFTLLNRFDIAMSHDRAYQDDFPAQTGVPDAFVEFNQGVIAFRRSLALQEALKEALRWTDTLWTTKGYPPDQAPFRIALFHSDVRVATLPLEYNCRFATYGYLNGTVRILHGRLPSGIRMRTEDFERVASTLNKSTVPRVFRSWSRVRVDEKKTVRSPLLHRATDGSPFSTLCLTHEVRSRVPSKGNV